MGRPQLSRLQTSARDPLRFLCRIRLRSWWVAARRATPPFGSFRKSKENSRNCWYFSVGLFLNLFQWFFRFLSSPIIFIVQKRSDDRPIFALKQRQVRNIVKRYGSIIGKDVHPHTFRHSYAIHCVRNGWDIRRLQQMLGHSSLNVTAVYLQFNDQDIKELYDKTPF